MTIVTIVLISIVLGAGTLIVTNIMKGLEGNKSTKCAEKGGAWNGTACTLPDGKTMLIDAGTSEMGDRVVEYIKDEELKIVKRMYIADEKGEVIEERSYEGQQHP